MSRFPLVRHPHDLRPVTAPAVAGYQPLLIAAAVACCFGAPGAQAQPAGAQAIHGSASLSQQGNKLVVTTANGAGSNHSAINWQSFSVPAGSVTQFNQPSAASTSINRVVGNNPSEIFGTLSSNGKLVLVNPSGIAVGAGAVVDTAGFTASTLRMSDADALAGRLVFGDGGAGSALSVGGQIVARSGDIVLIAPNIETAGGAVLQSPNGATILAAGQQVAITGRGLEGISLQVQAPTDSAVNLGKIEGDAVGIFAGTLKHSGLINATAVSSEGGRVVLKGQSEAEIAGAITASKGNLGGQVHATAGKVRLKSGAVIDVSGTNGGGEALLGGGWQGKDARLANASETTLEAGSTVKANASDNGNGGTVVAWSDQTTQVHGRIEATGGAQGGNGGNVETSGKQALDARGVRVDTRAPLGQTGNWLLDPTSITITGGCAPGPAPCPPAPAPAPAPGPSIVYEADLEASTTDITILAFDTIDVAGSFFGNALTLQSGINITLQTNATGGGTGVDLTGVPGLVLQASGGGSVTMLTGNSTQVIRPGNVQVTGPGTITLTSLGTVDITSSSLSTAGGAISITGAVDLNIVSPLVTSAGGEITLRGDRMAIGNTINSGAGRTVVLPFTTSRPITLGGPSEITALNLNSSEVNQITASTLVIGGNSYTGGIAIGNVGGAINPTGTSSLSLINSPAAGPGITQSAPFTVANLNADARAVILNNAGNLVQQV
ncbi:MAG: filamentous hemagglutinin N-terminal domain-containing protein, partial [Ramlibacter sp.]